MKRHSESTASFEAEALPHLDTLYRVALRLAGEHSRAEDLVQDTMLKAYRAWATYRRGTNARAWLLTILRNTFINEYRKDCSESQVEYIVTDTSVPYDLMLTAYLARRKRFG